MLSPFHHGLAFASQDCTAAIIDSSGKELTPFRYEGCARKPGRFSEGLASAAVAGGPKKQLGYIDQTGKFVIQPQFDQAAPFHEKLAAVDVGGLWGYINSSGEFIINPIFKMAGFFIQQRAYVCTNDGLIAIINPSGAVEHKTRLRCEVPDPPSDGLAGRLPFAIDNFYFATDIENGGVQVWLSADGREIYREHGDAPEKDNNPDETTQREATSPSAKSTLSGTAFAISETGFLLTNAHVVAGCDHVDIPASHSTADVIKVDTSNLNNS